MYAEKHDRLVIRNLRLDGPTRDGEILEVLHADGSPPYRVRWSDDGHESLIYPGVDAYVEHYSHAADAERSS
jgi:hypothetical protein